MSRVSYQINVSNLPSAQKDEYLQRLMESVTEISGDYRWNWEPFQLGLLEHNQDITSYSGQVEIGECLSDEWFILFILHQLSLRFSDLFISVEDEDGDAVLIEAAHCLPDWLSTVSMRNRCFIHCGMVHLIGADIYTSEPTLFEVSKCLGERTVASVAIQETIQRRLSAYPDACHDNTFYASCIIPRDVARVLAADPQTLSYAVHHFSPKDPDCIKAIRKRNLLFSPDTSLLMIVGLSKAVYAKLVCQKLHPPTAFLATEPLSSYLRRPQDFTDEFKYADLGAKITCAFEAWYHGDIALPTATVPRLPAISSRQYLDSLIKFSKTALPQDDQFDDYIIERNEELCSKYRVDDDSWMTITNDDLENLIKERTGMDQIRTVNDHSQFDDLKNDFEAFMGKMTDYLGAENDCSNDYSGSDSNVDDEHSEDSEMKSIMEQMDAELGKYGNLKNPKDHSGPVGTFQMMSNFLESHASQYGQSGPVQTILNSMGVMLPGDSGLFENEENSE